MAIKMDDIEIGKSYLSKVGSARKVLEIVPDRSNGVKFGEVAEEDIIRYESEKWGYDAAKYAGKTRVKVKTREKMRRIDFAKDTVKRLD